MMYLEPELARLIILTIGYGVGILIIFWVWDMVVEKLIRLFKAHYLIIEFIVYRKEFLKWKSNKE